MIKLFVYGSFVTLIAMLYVQVVRDQTCESNPQYLLGRWDGSK